ncbi:MULTISPECIES: hypothetical protein [Sinorhizobium]|uniref:hypothetical protein n=1 Tax=Sinorhizobium TaxID=28105 RepID=UPI000AC8AC71|nr:hypothetical protein [Sinorhizobium glycinis]
MASTLAKLPQLPPPQEPLVDPRTGRITQTWYLYLQRLDQHIREIEERLDAGGL